MMSMNMNYRRLLGVVLLGSTALASSAALAQTAIEQGAAVQETGLTDIVVTARKRAETTQDVPVSISAFDAKTLAAKDLTNLEKLATQSPQFTVGRAAIGSGAQLTIRGIGSSFSSIGLERLCCKSELEDSLSESSRIEAGDAQTCFPKVSHDELARI